MVPFGIVLFTLLSLGPFSPAWGAYGVEPIAPPIAPSATLVNPTLPQGSLIATPSKETVKKVQRFLRGQRFYFGPFDGRTSPALKRAIGAYQKKYGLPVDGKLTAVLMDRIEQNKKIEDLLHRLEDTRRKAIDKATKALLSHPQTRSLIEGQAKFTQETADPTRTTRRCFADPTPRCLLSEAFESAKAIYNLQMRDWALGEILVAQAKAGIADDAKEAVRRVHDPRLIISALRDIAKGQARSGQGAAALSAAQIIPDPQKKIEALIAIADIQSQPSHGRVRPGAPWPAIAQANALIEKIAPLRKRVELYARLGVIAAREGKAPRKPRGSRPLDARDIFMRAETLARSIRLPAQRNAALGQLAFALAKSHRPDAALKLIEAITGFKNNPEYTPVLMSSAKQQALLGNTEDALKIARSIPAARYRSLVFSAIALTQARGGHFAGAMRSIDTALGGAERVNFPFAKAYAFSRIALSLSKIAELTPQDPRARTLNARALKTAARIDDERLRAQILWAIAANRTRAGDIAGARQTKKRAQTASARIKSALDRVWMFADIAQHYAQERNIPDAREAFSRAFDEAKQIKNSWERARALAKAASALSEINTAVMSANP